MFIHTIEIICIIAFALSAVISESNKGKDIVSIMVIGWVTAICGGTVQDVILSTNQVFWISEIPLIFGLHYISHLLASFSPRIYAGSKSERLIVFLDAIGISMCVLSVSHQRSDRSTLCTLCCDHHGDDHCVIWWRIA